jgi:hypothetical protein
MKHATLSDLKEIYWQFQKRKDVFPHVRRDKLQKMIEKSLVIWQDGVVITYQQYKKKTRVGDLDIPAGSIMLHQILNSQQFSGKGSELFEQFVREVVGPQAVISTSVSARKTRSHAPSTSATECTLSAGSLGLGDHFPVLCMGWL